MDGKTYAKIARDRISTTNNNQQRVGVKRFCMSQCRKGSSNTEVLHGGLNQGSQNWEGEGEQTGGHYSCPISKSFKPFWFITVNLNNCTA